MDPITLAVGIASVILAFSTSGCATLSKEENKGSEPIWKGTNKG